MNTTDIINLISEDTGLTKTDARKFLKAFQDRVTTALQNDEKISLIGFMTLESKIRQASEGRHPQTGDKISIPEKKLVKIKAGKALVEAMN